MENAGKQNLLQYTTTTNSIPFQNSHAFCHFFQHPPAAGSSGGGGGDGGATTTTVEMNHVCSSSFSDPHFMCLNLGKRHYFGEATATAGQLLERPVDNTNNYYCLNKKGKVYDDGGSGGGGMVVVPRCQVDGCHVELGNAKEYHKRHKVCEVHAKAPIVVLFGIQQRFCQQCSRFHAVSEFDGSKRSCRRRLACHNERRRKSSQEHSAVQKHFIGNAEMMTRTRMHQQMQMQLPVGCAHSLLSSSSSSKSSTSSWIDSSTAVDLPSRCSTALRELIVKNRAAVLAQQLMLGNDLHTQGNFHAPHQNEPNRPC